jgi:hypothetical protein
MNETHVPTGAADTPWTSHVPPLPAAATSSGTEPAQPARGGPARGTLQAAADPLRGPGDEWIQGARTTIGSSPLVCLAAAFVLGALVARVTR